MARSKSPKKNQGVEGLASSSTTMPVSSPDSGTAETVAAESAAAETSKAEMLRSTTSRRARKPEIVKTEPRSKLVPINVEEEVRRLAYLLAERRGFEPGHETEDWLRAEHEIRERYHQQSA